MEIWKDIKNYEGIYQVSNYGNVRSFKKWCGNNHLKKWVNETSILKATDNGNGYLIVRLNKYGTRKNFYIHRLVATYFLDNPSNKNIVNHKDYNKYNNNVSNLEWVTQKENVNYSIKNMKHRKLITHSNTNEKYITFRASKNVYRVIIDKKEYGSFKTIKEAIIKRNEVLGVI